MRDGGVLSPGKLGSGAESCGFQGESQHVEKQRERLRLPHYASELRERGRQREREGEREGERENV